MGRTSLYPAEFRQEAARQVLEGAKSARQVAGELGIAPRTLGHWVAAERARRDGAGTLPESEREELRRLRRENRELKLEAEILRKAALYFAKETTR